MAEKKRLEYLEIEFINLGRGQRVRYSFVIGFLITFMLMIIFGYQDDIDYSRVFLITCFVAVFMFLLFFMSSRFARAHRFSKKQDYFYQIKEVRFKLRQISVFACYLIMLILEIYILFLIMFLMISYSDMVVMLLILFLGIFALYFVIFFVHDFSYFVCRDGLLVRGLGLPKFYSWKNVGGYRVKGRLVYFYFKNSDAHISLVYDKAIEKYLKKYIKRK